MNINQPNLPETDPPSFSKSCLSKYIGFNGVGSFASNPRTNRCKFAICEGKKKRIKYGMCRNKQLVKINLTTHKWLNMNVRVGSLVIQKLFGYQFFRLERPNNHATIKKKHLYKAHSLYRVQFSLLYSSSLLGAFSSQDSLS